MTAHQSSLQSSTKSLAIWTFFWTFSVAIATFGPKFIWGEELLLTLAAILLNVGLGIKMIIINIHFLNNLDELQRKIQLEAMAIALGATIVGGLAFSLLDITDVIGFDAEIGFLVIFTSLTYLVSLVLIRNKYL